MAGLRLEVCQVWAFCETAYLLGVGGGGGGDAVAARPSTQKCRGVWG